MGDVLTSTENGIFCPAGGVYIDPWRLAERAAITPPVAPGSARARRFGTAATSFASGWMALRGVRRRRCVDPGGAFCQIMLTGPGR